MQTVSRHSKAPSITNVKPDTPSGPFAFLYSPVFAYLMLALVQLKVVWGMWDFKDLDWGDTCCYFANACETFDRGRINIIWSPIFQFLGSLILHISHDPYFYCMTTRIVCALAISLLTLSVMSQHVVIEDLLELLHDVIAAQSGRQFAVDIDRSNRIFKGAWEADAEVRVLALAGAVDDAAHDG